MGPFHQNPPKFSQKLYAGLIKCYILMFEPNKISFDKMLMLVVSFESQIFGYLFYKLLKRVGGVNMSPTFPYFVFPN